MCLSLFQSSHYWNPALTLNPVLIILTVSQLNLNLSMMTLTNWQCETPLGRKHRCCLSCDFSFKEGIQVSLFYLTEDEIIQSFTYVYYSTGYGGLLRPALQAGFLKVWYDERMKNETQEFREKRGSGNQHLFKVKVPKLNPSQLYYTFSHEWKNKQGVKL